MAKPATCSFLQAQPSSSSSSSWGRVPAVCRWISGYQSSSLVRAVGALPTRKTQRLMVGSPRRDTSRMKQLCVRVLSTEAFDSNLYDDLKTGSPVVITEAPPLLKTAEPMPMMRPNKGILKPGDAGRILGRRPKDVWAVRFAIGAFLIDKKYFKPL